MRGYIPSTDVMNNFLDSAFDVDDGRTPVPDSDADRDRAAGSVHDEQRVDRRGVGKIGAARDEAKAVATCVAAIGARVSHDPGTGSFAIGSPWIAR